MTGHGNTHDDGVDAGPGSTMRSFVAATRIAWASAARWFVLRIGLAVAVAGVPVAVAWLTKLVLDRLVQPDRPLLAPVLLLAGTGVAAVVLPQVVRYVDEELQRSVGLSTRQRLYAAVGRMVGLSRFEDPRFHDRLTLAAERGQTGPAELVGAVVGVGQGLLTVAGFLGSLALLNPWMLVVVALAAVPTLRAEVLLGRHRVRMLSEVGQSWRREVFYAHLLTSVTAAKEVRLYGLGGLFGARMIAELRQIHARHRRMDRQELAVQGLLGLLGAVIAGAGLVWAAEAARDGRITVGDVSVFVAALAGVQGGLSVVTHNIGRAHEATLLFGHFRYVAEAGPDLAGASAGTRPVPPLRHGIEFRDVWFRYGADLPWVLRGVNLTIPAGAATALVGRNGAGKSTLVKLLCRFYEPTRGTIRWDGVELRDLPVDELRRRVGAVFQDFMAYELSAAENVGVGDLTALDDRDRIVAAALRAGCHDSLAALPRGYDTMLTRIFVDHADRDDPGTGVVLSGGQWQRVALARALLRDGCDLLILDEPSAGLDAEAEYEVHRQLRAHRAGRTSLLISHRLNSVRDADTIVVLVDGTVAEQGRHARLLADGGVYARLFGLQAAGYRDDVRWSDTTATSWHPPAGDDAVTARPAQPDGPPADLAGPAPTR
ncbi:ABC transporter ATP-binding protein [Plantactinospora endophytica]|uniref:Multidrug ABC transporter permease n=1 Tax=Plantactinospora endophytica TaxID=673535 RepID=A0ABQ4E9A7_9ACTN|nr:ABC transporter ATP-binding protein [Plantactinospora endophytica]GIG91316.1 multidrug ABC transporter permease [Plantactinospora endophytica]